MADQKTTQLTALTTPSDDDIFPLVDDPSGTPVTKKVTWANIKATILAAISSGPFTSDSNTWTYASADGVYGTISINADMTAVLSPGMRILYTQTSQKQAIIVSVGAYSGGATVIGIINNADYTLANASITSPKYSDRWAPAGFTMDRTKYRLRLADTSDRTQSSPGNGSYYNPGSLSIDLLPGIWDVYVQGHLGMSRSSGGTCRVWLYLSTANNSASSEEMSSSFLLNPAVTDTYITKSFRKNNLSLSSKTTHYLVIRQANSSANEIGIYGGSDSPDTIVEAQLAYI